MLLLKVCCSLLALVVVAVSGQEHRAVQKAVDMSNMLSTCIDDSDCKKLGQGNKYACFMYICYPWQDDSEVPADEKRDTCRRTDDCQAGQTCYRHHDKRNINRGLCFAEIKECEDSTECSQGFGCCGGYCCEQQYYTKYTDLPCVSHIMCQDVGLGKYCCPRGENQTSVCCNTDPNPPVTEEPQPAVGAARGLRLSSEVVVLAVLLPAWLLSKLL